VNVFVESLLRPGLRIMQAVREVLADAGSEPPPLARERGHGRNDVPGVVARQALELVARQRRRLENPSARERLEEPREQAAVPEREVDERLARLADRGRDLAVDVVERQDVRPADLVALPGRVRLLERFGEDAGDVVDRDGLESRRSGADDGDEARVLPHDRHEQGDEPVAGPEDDRRPEDGPGEARGAHGFLARGLGAPVLGRRVLGRSHRAHVEVTAHTRALGGGDGVLRRDAVHAVEGLPALLVNDPDEVDQRLAPRSRRMERLRVEHVSPHGFNRPVVTVAGLRGRA